MKAILFLLSLAVGLTACELDDCRTKNTFLKSHKAFVTKTLEQKEDLSSQEWEEKDLQFERFVEECYEKYESELSKEEKKEFWKASSKYFVHRFQREVEHHLSMNEEDLEEYREIFEDLGADITESFQEVFDEDFSASMKDLRDEMKEFFGEDFKKELKKAFDDDFKKDLKDAMKDLKEGLKELNEDLKEISEEEDK